MELLINGIELTVEYEGIQDLNEINYKGTVPNDKSSHGVSGRWYNKDMKECRLSDLYNNTILRYKGEEYCCRIFSTQTDPSANYLGFVDFFMVFYITDSIDFSPIDPIAK